MTDARARRFSAGARAIGIALTAIVACWWVAGLAVFTAKAHGQASALFTVRASDVDAALESLGWNSGALFVVVVAIELAVGVATLIASGFILAAPRVTAYTAILAPVLVAFAATAAHSTTGRTMAFPPSAPATAVATAIASMAFLALAPLFPTGTALPRWSVAIPLTYSAFGALSLIVPWWSTGATWPIMAASTLAVMLVIATVVAQVIRYRRFSDRTARQQTKWVVMALCVYLATLVPVFVLPPGSIAELTGAGGVAFQVIRPAISALAFGAMAVAIALAIARYRLFDVDLILRRTVVWGTLVALITLVYIAAVGVAGLIWQGSGIWPAMAATLLVALLAHPLRMWLQRRANRWIYGERGDPYAVVSQLGDHLRDAHAVTDIATRVTEVLVHDLRYSYAAVSIDGRRFEQGDATARTLAPIVLTREGRAIGTIVVGAAPGDRVSAADDTLVGSVATQAGLALGAALADEEVRASRERLVTAREDERRRLCRGLHDGVGPALAGARQRIDTALALRETNPDASLHLLEEASAGLDEMLGDVRGLVQGLRPPALDELGLVAAVRVAAEPVTRSLRVVVDGSAGGLSPAIEVAAHRIAVEAITNASRHSGADVVTASFEVAGATLRVRITDNGRGFGDTPATADCVRCASARRAWAARFASSLRRTAPRSIQFSR